MSRDRNVVKNNLIFIEVYSLVLGYGQKGRKKRSAGSGGVVRGLVASMEKFLSCKTPETQIEGVDVWHLLHNHIDGRLLVCGSIYSFSYLLKGLLVF